MHLWLEALLKTKLHYFQTADVPIYCISESPNGALFGGSAVNNLVYITIWTLQTIYTTDNQWIQINTLYID